MAVKHLAQLKIYVIPCTSIEIVTYIIFINDYAHGNQIKFNQPLYKIVNDDTVVHISIK